MNEVNENFLLYEKLLKTSIGAAIDQWQTQTGIKLDFKGREYAEDFVNDLIDSHRPDEYSPEGWQDKVVER